MSDKHFKIQKLSDRSIAIALGKIGSAIGAYRPTHIVAHFEHIGEVRLDALTPENTPAAQFSFSIDSSIADYLILYDSQTNCQLVKVTRQTDAYFDNATLTTDIAGRLSGSERDEIYRPLIATLSSNFMREFRVAEFAASMRDQSDTEWERYRSAQLSILNSLQETSERVLVTTTKAIADSKALQEAEYLSLRKKLEDEVSKTEMELRTLYESKMHELNAREEELDQKLANYNTHEALYVARKKAEEQLTQLKSWLTNSSLTKETVAKRRPVFFTYVVAIGVSIGFAVWYSFQGYQVATALGREVINMPWWQWVAITFKAVVPIAAFTTFAIYFMRWEGAWARQHAEEELRLRSRMIDIGRSTWLLEAVRDQKGGDKVDPALLAELSKNLFADHVSTDSADQHPTTLTDFVEKLSSLRLRTPDGTEIEASRAKK